MAGLGILEPLDPNSRSATILGDGGPSALEVAYKRKGLEADIGKNIAEAEAAKAKNKIEDDKNKIEQNKQFDLLPATAKTQHSEVFANFYNEQSAKIADILARNGGIAPIAGPDGAAFRRSTQAIKQMASNSEQLDTELIRQLAIVQANPTKYLPGTADKLTKEFYDPKWLLNNEMPQNLVHGYFDVNGYLESLFSKIKADQDATGYVTAEGGTDESTTKYILRDDIKALAVMGASDLNAFPALTRQLQNMSPEMQGKIAKIAQDNGITPEAAAALELGIGLVEFTEKTRNVTAPGDGGSGAALAKGSLWFGKYLEDVMAGDYQTEEELGGKPKPGQPGYETVEIGGVDFPGAQGFFVKGKNPTGLRLDNTLKGFTWDDKVVYDPEAKTQVRTMRDIKKVAIDYPNKRFLVAVGEAGDKKKANETVEVPFDQAESKLGPMILGHNKNLIAGQGAYDRAAETTGEGTRKGAGAQNIVKTPTTAPQPKAETPKKKAY